jgi:diguanylate cyclase (GGDEF)-like protein
LIPEDGKQAHRVRRVLFACAGVVVFLSVLVLYYFAGLIEPGALLAIAAVSSACAAFFYALIRSGLNRRARDPSLTFPMILASMAMLLLAMSQVSEGRQMLSMVALMPFMFGVFRLNTAQMLGVAALFLAGYGAILWGDWQAARAVGASREVVLEWLVSAAVLCWFGLFAGYISRLRKQLADTNAGLGEAIEQVRTLMSHDELTGLYTRRHLMEVLERERRRSERADKRFCVLMLDLDRFKNINDTHGHGAGDEALRCFSRTLAPVLRPEDILGRFGGEEFLVVSGDTALEGGQALAERIRQAVETMAVPGLPARFRMTVSIGVAQFENGETTESLLGRADLALYAAKQGGRNRVEVAYLAPKPASRPAPRRKPAERRA